MTDADRARIARLGLATLSTEHGLELFDAGREVADAVLLAAPLDRAALRSLARSGSAPPLLRGLVRAPMGRAAGDAEGALQRSLAGKAAEEWPAIVLELVREQAAGVLGHASAEAIAPDRPFKELGFDSLGGVELRNRLGRVSGLRLPSTLVFDYPTAAAVADHVVAQLGAGGDRPAIDDAIDKLDALLASLAADAGERERVHHRLESFDARLRAFLADGAADEVADHADLEAASDDELFDLIDKELG
jgi:acyl carrier protein